MPKSGVASSTQAWPDILHIDVTEAVAVTHDLRLSFLMCQATGGAGRILDFHE